MIHWKLYGINIIQIIETNTWIISVIGLGSDCKLYEWDVNNGAWKEYWHHEDDNAPPNKTVS